MRIFTSKLVGWVFASAVFLVVASMFMPLVNRSPDGGHRSRCQSNLRQIGLGIAQYVQDYDDHLPLISAGKQGWTETLQPYMKSWQIFQCPVGEKPADQKGPLSSDYFLNARVTGLKRSRISFGAQTLLLGEGPDNGGTNSHFSELPFDWLTAEKSPIKRHLDGANYAWVDGHVKWLLPQKITTLQPSEGANTFAVR